MPRTEPGKVALITGAARPLGRDLSLAMVDRGYALIAESGDPNAADIKAFVREIIRKGGRALAASHDLSTATGAEEAVTLAVETFGGLDAVVTCPPLEREQSITRIDEISWNRLLSHHLSATFLTCQAAVKWMIEHAIKGRIIAVTGPPGALTSEYGQAHIAAVSGGICSHVRTTAAELRRKGITVNALAPSLVPALPTDTTPEFQSESVVPLVLFLLSDKANAVTGQIITISGRALAVAKNVASAGVVLIDGEWTVDQISDRWAELSR